VWSDYLWHHHDTFLERMPRSVLQSNWYYGVDFGPEDTAVRAYLDLDESGFEQVPTASNHSHSENFEMTVAYCRRSLDASRTLGYMQTPWRPTTEQFRREHLEAIEQVAEVRKSVEG
jgi:hypothetical protein